MVLLVHDSCTKSIAAQTKVDPGASSLEPQCEPELEGKRSKRSNQRCRGSDAETLRKWLMEYWAACYSEDLSPLRAMMDYLEPLDIVPVVAPSTC
jgi:hypothetical protein